VRGLALSNTRDLTGLFVDYRTTLARAVARIVPPREVEDIVQETYVRLCQLDPGTRVDHPRSLLSRIARNLALDHVKRAEFRLTDGAPDFSDAEAPDLTEEIDETLERAASDEEFSHLCDAVRNLPPKAQRVFILRKVYGYSQREIAARLKLSERTVEKHIALGIRRCADHLARIGDQP